SLQTGTAPLEQYEYVTIFGSTHLRFPYLPTKRTRSKSPCSNFLNPKAGILVSTLKKPIRRCRKNSIPERAMRIFPTLQKAASLLSSPVVTCICAERFATKPCALNLLMTRLKTNVCYVKPEFLPCCSTPTPFQPMNWGE